MIPGEVICPEGEIELNAGQPVTELEVANTGPVAPNSMAMALTGALTITRGTVSGWTLGDFSPKNRS